MKNKIFYFLFIAILLIFPNSTTAINPNKDITQHQHRIWKTEHGLPQNSVRSIVQTRNGYLWLGTEEGLVRFDGIQFTVYDKNNTSAFKSNLIQKLLEDKAGNLWIATGSGGLIKYSDGEFTVLTTNNGLASNTIMALHEDRFARLWIATTNGLNILADDTVTTYNTLNGLADNIVYSLTEDEKGRIWIGTNGGMSRFENGQVAPDGTFKEWVGKTINFTYLDRLQNLWFNSEGNLYRLENGGLKSVEAVKNLLGETVFCAFEDKFNNLWFGTSDSLVRFSNGGYERYDASQGIVGQVRSMIEDREGNFWLGSTKNGLHRISDGKFSKYTVSEGLASNHIYSIYEDRANNLWVGTDKGLNRIQSSKFITYTTKNGLSSNKIYSIYEDRTGNLWVGTGNGLNKITNNSIEIYTTKNGLASNIINAIYEDRNGRIWIGAFGKGLNLFERGQFTSYSAKNGLCGSTVLRIFEARNGVIWFGCRNGGLSRFDGEQLTVYPTGQVLNVNEYFDIHEDVDGVLWFGTNNGLYRFKNNEFVGLTMNEGLLDDKIYRILVDDSDNFWTSCNKGLSKVSRSELNAVADGKIDRVASFNYTIWDGLPSSEFNGGLQYSGWKTQNAQLLFPTVEGVAIVEPDKIIRNMLPPPVTIEKLSVDGIVTDISQTAAILPGVKRLVIEYTALSFVAPERVRFRYKLEGYDREWMDAGFERKLTYTNLPPGNYRFRVIASNNDGVWNESGAALNFHLQPRFYQTYWFFVLCLAVSLLCGWIIHQIRLQINLQRVQAMHSAVMEERTRLSREIHDTLTQSFVGISSQLEAIGNAIHQKPETAKQHLNLARRMVRHSLTEARRSASDLRSQMLENSNLETALKELVKLQSAGTGIATHIEIIGEGYTLSEHVEQNLLRIAQEAIANAIKHAQTKEIWIKLEYQQKVIKLIVVDNGCGFEENKTHSILGGHFGLLGMRERAKKIGGELSIESAPQNGTKISITVTTADHTV